MVVLERFPEAQRRHYQSQGGDRSPCFASLGVVPMGVWGLAPISREAIKKGGCGGLPPLCRKAVLYTSHTTGDQPAGFTLLVLPGLPRISGHFRTNHGVARSWLTLGTTHEWTKYSWDTHGPPPKRRGAGAKKKVPYVPRTFVEVGRNQAISHKKWDLGFVFRFERLKMER